MKDIIVVGYPKSGNTWVTRLTAELVGCPVPGFWKSDHWEVAREGLDRVSEFRCYKAHHQLHELGIAPDNPDCKLIYVVRDPRDIAISGAHYFRFNRFKFLGKIIHRIPAIQKWYDERGYASLHPESYRIDQMSKAVIFGDPTIHGWVRIPWNTHYRAYLNSNALFVRYETLLTEPYPVCADILNHLGLQRSPEFIASAIEKQSFESRKNKFMSSGNKTQATFLREGKSEQWRSKLTPHTQQLFSRHLSDDLNRFSYAV